MPLTGAAREFHDSQKGTACNRPARGQSCTNATYDAGNDQEKLGQALGVTFQQVQKYEKGTNRIGASRLQHIASIQQVAISFFFEDAPGQSSILDEPCDYVSGFLATSGGLALTKAYMQIENAKLRRSIVALVKQIAGEDEPEQVTVRII
jgi:transcriptional regulator with XRE-family HTH domain